jgi:hypothetical protein
MPRTSFIALAAGAIAPFLVPSGSRAADVFFEALHGPAEAVAGGTLLASPGRFVGRAVRTTGRLVAVDAGALQFDVALEGGRTRLRLEPEAKAVLVAKAAAWEGKRVEVEGLFYRDAGEGAAASYAMRAWSVRAPDEPAAPAARPSATPVMSLEDLVYAAGKYDAKLVRVRGTYRGPNRHRDLPEATRKGGGDWVLKDGYFAAWVTGRDPRGEGWDLTRPSTADADATVEVAGVPTTERGVVRIAAREVALYLGPEGGVALSAPRAAGAEAVPPRVAFAYPVAGETIGRRGHVVVQFSKPLDPRSLESRVRVRVGGAAATAARHAYRERARSLVVTVQPPPPAGTEVVVELMEGIIDIDGRALAGAGEASGGVVESVRFRSGP